MKLLILILLSFSSYAQLSIETFNTGLAHTYVPLAEERLPLIINDLKVNKSDVLCLQEVWTQEDRDRIIKELKSVYPYSHFSEIKQVRSKRKPTCKIKNLFGKGKFVSCTLKECKGKDGDDFTQCVLNTCGESMEKLKNDNRVCANALLAQVGKSSLGAITQVLNPFKGASMFAYGGGDGLLLLSRKKMNNKSIIDLSDISTLNKRAALVATIESVELNCTHLSANLADSVAYAGKFESWQEENSKQIERLINNTSSSEGKRILMGDFNCAFATGSLEPDWEENCQQILDSQFENTFIDEDPACTYCSSNSHNPVTTKDILIDHIFSKNVDIRYHGITRENKILINNKKENLSDHFGVRAFIE
ncbi:endonuclease/exonuclease/phosphatase family protein [Halobacteriovorax sp. HLS]|uniref:endonuclease/exonuclease/phosphatase family protein n=1 Tax=Halobacteriovorax sp. HLS TaxID=2234000 RepID=UPI000FD8433B|nr:endonuclease/exonuclease/phosphatase family protein [Halobacteriovorax sp. HLS]